ncbi:MAG: hypothetical protein JKY34_11210, partial [Kordiimonadaceae bacterium]|nr:hypothetical protein [Kordiimonadaceae bacterium]
MKEEQKDRLKQARIAAGYASGAEATRSFGWGYEAYKANESGKRKLTSDTAERYGKAYSVKPEWLLYGASHSDPTMAINKTQSFTQTVSFSVPVVGAVQAGHWVSMDILDEIKEAGLEVPGDPHYKEFDQYAVKIVGDSINNFAKDGEYAICVDIHAGIDPEDGDYVVVEALRNGGAEIETTIKQLRITLDGPELWPDSTNPKHNGPIYLGKNGDEVRIKAVVL